MADSAHLRNTGLAQPLLTHLVQKQCLNSTSRSLFSFLPCLAPCLLLNPLLCLSRHIGAWNEDLNIFFALNLFGPACWTPVTLSIKVGFIHTNSSCIWQQKAQNVIVSWGSDKAWKLHSISCSTSSKPDKPDGSIGQDSNVDVYWMSRDSFRVGPLSGPDG